MTPLAAVEVSPVVQKRGQRKGEYKAEKSGLQTGAGEGDNDENEDESDHDEKEEGRDSTPAMMAGLINKESLFGAGSASVSGSGSVMGQTEVQEKKESALKRAVKFMWATSFADREQRQQSGDLQENKDPEPGVENMEICGERGSARMKTGGVDTRTNKDGDGVVDVEVDAEDDPGYESIPTSATPPSTPATPPVPLSAVRVASESLSGDINRRSLTRVLRETSKPATSGRLTNPNLTHKDMDISSTREKTTRTRSSGKPDTYEVVVSPEREPQISRNNPNPVKNKRGRKPKQLKAGNENGINETGEQEREQEAEEDHDHVSTEGFEDGISLVTRKRTRSQSTGMNSTSRKRISRANVREPSMAPVDDSKQTENLIANRNSRFERHSSQQPGTLRRPRKYSPPEEETVPVVNERLSETAAQMVERGLHTDSVELDLAALVFQVLDVANVEKDLPDNRDNEHSIDTGVSNMEPSIDKSAATRKRSGNLKPKTPISINNKQQPEASNNTPHTQKASSQSAKANTPAKKKRVLQSMPEETVEQYEKKFAERLKMQKKDTFFRRERRMLGLPPVGSQAESSSYAQSQETTSSQPVEADQSAEKRRRYRVPELDNSEEIYQKKLADRLEMQGRDAFFKRSRERLGLPPVGSQQIQIINEPSLANISLARHPSSNQQFEQQSNGPTPVDLVVDLDNTYITSQARDIQRQLLNVREQQRQLTAEQRKLENSLEEMLNSGVLGNEPVDTDGRLLGMFGTKQSASLKPRKWTLKEMTFLIEGLRHEQGPDRYELIHEAMPDRSFDEIFDMAKYFKETMIERDKESRLRNPSSSHPPLEEFIQNIGLELSSL